MEADLQSYLFYVVRHFLPDEHVVVQQSTEWTKIQQGLFPHFLNSVGELQ